MSEEMVQVILSPYKETPQWYRTTVKVEGNKRWFEKSKVSVAYRDESKIVLEIPKVYADTRQGIASLILHDEFDPSSSRDSGAAAKQKDSDEHISVQVGPAGRIVIPAAFRDAMEIKEGDRLRGHVVNGELRLISSKMAIRWAQERVRQLISGNESLVDALIEERQREFADELENG